MHPLSTGMELRSASRPAVCQLGERQPVSAALDALASGCSGEGAGTAGVYEGYSESLLEALDYSPDLSQRILPELRLAVQLLPFQRHCAPICAELPYATCIAPCLAVVCTLCRKRSYSNGTSPG